MISSSKTSEIKINFNGLPSLLDQDSFDNCFREINKETTQSELRQTVRREIRKTLFRRDPSNVKFKFKEISRRTILRFCKYLKKRIAKQV